MVQQSAPGWLRDYADENRLFHCTEVSIPHLVVLDAYTKVLPSGVFTRGLFRIPNLGWRIRRQNELTSNASHSVSLDHFVGAPNTVGLSSVPSAFAVLRLRVRSWRELSSGDQVSPGRFDPKTAMLPSQLPEPRF
jgi:hypothetical protein